jgi:predicted enzyme related to lactoylglutathione lyase
MEKAAPIVFFDIAGPNRQKLSAFYSDLFGWKIDAASGEIPAESTSTTPGVIRQDPPEKVLYLGVADITQTLKKIVAAGGKINVPRTVVPGVVTFALFEDPAGNRMGLAEFGSYPTPKKQA